jgi:hypothetical protein
MIGLVQRLLHGFVRIMTGRQQVSRSARGLAAAPSPSTPRCRADHAQQLTGFPSCSASARRIVYSVLGLAVGVEQRAPVIATIRGAWRTPLSETAHHACTVIRHNACVTYRWFRSACDDVTLLMATVLLFPLAILVMGAPIALCVRGALAILRRL